MKRTPLRILVAIVVPLLASTFIWNFSMHAAHPSGPGKKGRGRANNPAKGNFDIRDRRSEDAVLKLERRLEKLSSKQKEKNAGFRLAMESAIERKAGSVEGLEVTFSDLTNSPEVIEVRGKGRKFLTPPSSQPRESVLKGFINDNPGLFGMNPRQVAMLRKTAEYTNPNGKLSWLRMEHRWNGMKVFRGEAVAAFTSGGEMARMVGELTPGPEEQDLATVPNVSAAAAVVAAAAYLDVTLTESELAVKETSPDGRKVVFHPAGPFTSDIELRLQYFPLDTGLATLAWSMVLWQDAPAHYTLVDAEVPEVGLLFSKQITDEQTEPATYKVYDGNSPAPLAPTTALPGSGIQGAAIPRTLFTLISELPGFDNLGWLTDGVNTTTGNNVDAGLDLVDPDGIDPDGRPTGSPARVFDFNYNPAPGIPPPGDAPTLADYRFGEVVNMFFWSNRYHDRLYELGFNEAARNFQSDNFGRGGLGNDPVLAQAQDFSGINNANFATPPDGTSGRMQMFVFIGPDPDRSSGLDQEVMLHELTHGLSNRLHNNAAGLTTTMSRGMGEGWSDFYGLSLLSKPGDDPHGIYAAGGYLTLQQSLGFTDNYYYGVRRFPYATISTVGPNGKPHNPLTLADIDIRQVDLTDGAFPRGPIGSSNPFESHNIGEVWCSALWEVRARIIDRLGFAAGNQRTLQLVTDGMKLDPVSPSLLDGRNSIVAASCAAFGGEDEQDIWAGFAARGMGFSASATSNSDVVVEAFDMPNLRIGAVTVSDDSCAPSDGVADPGETLTFIIPLTNPFCTTPVNGVTISVDGGAPVSYGDIPAGATVSRGVPFTVPSGAACGSLLTVDVVISSSLGTVTRTFKQRIGRPVVTLSTSFISGNIAVPIPDLGSVDIPINVPTTGIVSDVNVRVRLDHSFDSNLVLTLIGPDGTSVDLARNRGGSGQNFGAGPNSCLGSPTTFDDSAFLSIGLGSAPFTGGFKPDSLLSAFNDKPSNGRWVLRVTDVSPGAVGTVGCFQLLITLQRSACCGVPGAPEIRLGAPVTLANESCAPGNGAPDPDETVTVNVPLSNIGVASTTNLVGTLRTFGGVVAPTGPQTYGAIVPGGPPVTRPFTFTVAGVCGASVTGFLDLQDGATNLGTLLFGMRIGVTATATSSFSNTTPIIIPATGIGDPAGAMSNPYPSTINVSGLSGTITRLTAQLFDFNHVSPEDVDVLLAGPGARKLLLMSDVGGVGSATNINLTFDDAGGAMPPNYSSGTFSPTNSQFDLGPDLFPAPAPPGPYPDPQRLSTFLNLSPNGLWNLFVVDDLPGFGGGNINGGWQLNITTVAPVCCSSACVLSAPPDIVVNNDPGVCGAVVNYPAPTFSGSCGVVTSNPPSGSLFPIGSTTVTVKGTRMNGATTTSSFTVTVNAPTTTTVPAVSGQYSDQVTLKANVTNVACPGGAVEFKVNGSVVGSAPVISGAATLPYTIPLSQGSYPIMATYSSSSSGTGSNGSGELTVTKEDAVVTVLDSNPTSVKVNSPGGTAGPITLCATINEASDASPGDISLATPVTFTLTPVAPGAPTITQTATTSGGGVGGTLTACVTLSNVPVNVYDVSVSVGGKHYTGTGGAVLAVYDPSLGFVTGGGTVVHDGVTATFGFNVKYKRNGAPQGEFLYIECRPTGLVKLKGTSMQSLSIVGNTGVFIGKATLNDVGNHTFRATVVDNGEPGKNDQFGLRVNAPGGAVIPDLTFDPITLSGGNIQIPHLSGDQATSSKTALK
jgi:extracellular elastinolytic metalloproteinase